MAIKIIKDSINKLELENLTKERFGDFVKAVVDIEQEIMAIGGDLHADEEAVLIENGSRQEDLWGINIYPFIAKDKRVEFDSLINIRPSVGNRSRYVESPKIKEMILKIVKKLIK